MKKCIQCGEFILHFEDAEDFQDWVASYGLCSECRAEASGENPIIIAIDKFITEGQKFSGKEV